MCLEALLPGGRSKHEAEFQPLHLMDEGGFDGEDSPDASPSGAATSCSCLTMIVVKNPSCTTVGLKYFPFFKKNANKPASVPAEVGGRGKKYRTKSGFSCLCIKGSMEKKRRGKWNIYLKGRRGGGGVPAAPALCRVVVANSWRRN